MVVMVRCVDSERSDDTEPYSDRRVKGRNGREKTVRKQPSEKRTPLPHKCTGREAPSSREPGTCELGDASEGGWGRGGQVCGEAGGGGGRKEEKEGLEEGGGGFSGRSPAPRPRHAATPATAQLRSRTKSSSAGARGDISPLPL